MLCGKIWHVVKIDIKEVKGMFEVDGDIVRRLYFETGLSLRQFATATGLNIFTIRRLLLGEETRVTGRIVSALAKYFGVDAETLLVREKSATA